MARKWFKKWLPNRQAINKQKSLQIFGAIIHHPNLWVMNRYSISTAFSIGMIWAWVPIPFQMVCSAATAIMFRANLPLSVALVWLTNPLTMPALFYFAYRVGQKTLGMQPQSFAFELSWDWIGSGLVQIWQPFLFGCFICGIISAITTNIAVRCLWRLSVKRHWLARKARRLQQQSL